LKQTSSVNFLFIFILSLLLLLNWNCNFLRFSYNSELLSFTISDFSLLQICLRQIQLSLILLKGNFWFWYLLFLFRLRFLHLCCCLFLSYFFDDEMYLVMKHDFLNLLLNICLAHFIIILIELTTHYYRRLSKAHLIKWTKLLTFGSFQNQLLKILN